MNVLSKNKEKEVYEESNKQFLVVFTNLRNNELYAKDPRCSLKKIISQYLLTAPEKSIQILAKGSVHSKSQLEKLDCS